MASPAPRLEPKRETWNVEHYRASDLPQILRLARREQITGSVTIHLSQGTAAGLEVRTKVKEANGSA